MQNLVIEREGKRFRKIVGNVPQGGQASPAARTPESVGHVAGEPVSILERQGGFSGMESADLARIEEHEGVPAQQPIHFSGSEVTRIAAKAQAGFTLLAFGKPAMSRVVDQIELMIGEGFNEFVARCLLRADPGDDFNVHIRRSSMCLEQILDLGDFVGGSR